MLKIPLNTAVAQRFFSIKYHVYPNTLKFIRPISHFQFGNNVHSIHSHCQFALILYHSAHCSHFAYNITFSVTSYSDQAGIKFSSSQERYHHKSQCVYLVAKGNTTFQSTLSIVHTQSLTLIFPVSIKYHQLESNVITNGVDIPFSVNAKT